MLDSDLDVLINDGVTDLPALLLIAFTGEVESFVSRHGPETAQFLIEGCAVGSVQNQGPFAGDVEDLDVSALPVRARVDCVVSGVCALARAIQFFHGDGIC